MTESSSCFYVIRRFDYEDYIEYKKLDFGCSYGNG